VVLLSLGAETLTVCSSDAAAPSAEGGPSDGGLPPLDGSTGDGGP
jgi:hypothetical protein